MKKIIKRIPIIRELAVKINQRFYKICKFTTSSKYWENRYRSGGNSGDGSYNKLAEFKGEIINNFIADKQIVRVIEFGCGDGNQLKYLKIPRYLGYDISKKAIKLCTAKFKEDDKKNFKHMNSYNDEIAELTMSLDVIFHLIEDQTFLDYMNILFKSSNKYVIIYSSNYNEFKLNAVHVKHRKFTDWIEENQRNFKLMEQVDNKYPFNGDGKKTSFADFYIYEKQD